MLPGHLRKHVYPIYAFARHADDLADESGDREALLAWRGMLHRCLTDSPQHPIFLALADTIRKFNLPLALFDSLLTAFLQDLAKNRYRDMEELTAYCQNSANPVGRLILLLHGMNDAHLLALSDDICTALQLTNFWQDVGVDLKKGRIYFPQNILNRFGVTEQALLQGETNAGFAQMMAHLISYTRSLFRRGSQLLDHLHGRLHWEIRLTLGGGMRILAKIEAMNFAVINQRPSLQPADWIRILTATLIPGQTRYA